jgi:uncharacterized protein (TIGR02594 family)
MDMPWIVAGKKYVGLREIPGPRHDSTIVMWLKKLNAWWTDDETPWCGVFVAHCMQSCNLKTPKYWMRAKDWNEGWGVKLKNPIVGCVVVFERKGGGHVGFVLGETSDDRLVVLGGNQSNMVNIAKFDKSRVVGYYWPGDYKSSEAYNYSLRATLPTLAVNGGLSTNEA